jgi:hypothetical protein
MADYMMENGKIIRDTGRVNLYGLMVEFLKVSLRMILKMDLGNLLSWMEKFILESGRMINSMEKAR